MCRSPVSPPHHESDHVSGGSVETIVYILTSGGRRIPALAKILVINRLMLELKNIIWLEN